MRPTGVFAAVATLGIALYVLGGMARTVTPPLPKTDPGLSPTVLAATTKPEVKVSATEQQANAIKAHQQEATDPADRPDYHPTNPFDPLVTVPGPKPIATIEAAEFDFDSMALGTTRTHSFIIKNTGDAVLKLAKGLVQCKCTSPKMKRDEFPEVAPGETFSMDMEWKPLTVDQAFLKQATIWTNDPEHPKVVVTINGKVFSALEAHPEFVGVGQVDFQTDKDFTFVVFSQLSDSFTITGVEKPDEIELTHGPLAAPPPGVSTTFKRAYEFKGKLKWRDQLGKLSHSIKVLTDCPEGPEFTVSVSGVRSGPYSITSKHWYAEQSLIRLDRFKADKGKKIEMLLYIPPFGEPLVFTQTEARPKSIKATLVKDEKYPVVSKELYRFSVEVPPGPALEFASGNPGMIKVKTNHPQFPELEFAVEYRAD